MKKHLFDVLLALLFVLLTTGCEKELMTDDSSKDVPANANVVLRFSAYDQMSFPTRANQDITALCSRLNIAFFKNGEKVKTISQKSGDAGYGSVALSLAEGNYELVVIAHNSTGAATISTVEKVTFPSNIVSDTFYYYGDLTVSSTQTTYDLQLVRVVAMFRLELTNVLPSTAAKIRFYYTGGSSTFSPLAGYGCVNSRQTVMINLEPGQKVFEVYTFPHEESDVLKMTVTVYDSGDNILKEQVFEEVPVTRNQITRYVGDFFNGSSGGSSSSGAFRMMADGEWDLTNSYTF